MSFETRNAANAQHSTGPRTPEGRARSSQNSRKHGLTSSQLIAQPDEQPILDEFIATYQAELSPQGILQQTLFDELVAAAWNLRRVRLMLTASELAAIMNPGDGSAEKNIDRLLRYQTHNERILHRSLRELKALQTDDALRAFTPRGLTNAPPLASPVEIAKRTQQLQNRIEATNFQHRSLKALEPNLKHLGRRPHHDNRHHHETNPTARTASAPSFDKTNPAQPEFDAA